VVVGLCIKLDSMPGLSNEKFGLIRCECQERISEKVVNHNMCPANHCRLRLHLSSSSLANQLALTSGTDAAAAGQYTPQEQQLTCFIGR
jgi:hypothetical protein